MLKNLPEDEVLYIEVKRDLKEKWSRPPYNKSTISEIITEHEDENGNTIQTLQKAQVYVHARINDL